MLRQPNVKAKALERIKADFDEVISGVQEQLRAEYLDELRAANEQLSEAEAAFEEARHEVLEARGRLKRHCGVRFNGRDQALPRIAS